MPFYEREKYSRGIMPSLKVRKSIPGMTQHILYIPTHDFRRAKDVARELSCSINEFILQAIDNAVFDKELIWNEKAEDELNKEEPSQLDI